MTDCQHTGRPPTWKCPEPALYALVLRCAHGDEHTVEGCEKHTAEARSGATMTSRCPSGPCPVEVVAARSLYNTIE